MSIFLNPMSSLIRFVIRLLMLVVGAVFVAVVVSVALLFAVVLIVTSLIRGRRPVLRASFRADPRAAWSRFNQAAGVKPKPMGEIVDVEMREVPESVEHEPAPARPTH